VGHVTLPDGHGRVEMQKIVFTFKKTSSRTRRVVVGTALVISKQRVGLGNQSCRETVLQHVFYGQILMMSFRPAGLWYVIGRLFDFLLNGCAKNPSASYKYIANAFLH